jgi:hypothetical protein
MSHVCEGDFNNDGDVDGLPGKVVSSPFFIAFSKNIELLYIIIRKNAYEINFLCRLK